MRVTRLPTDPGPAAWDTVLPPGRRYPELTEAATADWLVIGAGFAGLAAARRLRQSQPTDRITVLEARQIAEGPVGRNSGFMIDLPHNLVSEDYSGALEADRMQTAMNRAAIKFAEEASEDYRFTPETLVRSGKTNVAASDKGAQHNRDYAAHLEVLEEAHELLDAAQMRALCGSDYYQSGLYTPGTAMLQPALYAREMAAGLASQNVDIFENSPVVELGRNAGIWTAKTLNGSIQAPAVILAVNGHVESFGFFKRRLIHIYLYASMTRALTESEQQRLGGAPLWAFTPADPMGTTVRKTNGIGGTRIVVRNGVTWSPSRTDTMRSVEKMRKAHDRSFKARFPMLGDVDIEYRWGGLLCLSRNGVGAFGEVDRGLYAACCQNGLGAARGTFSGMMAADLACGSSSQIFSQFLQQDAPSRLPPEPFASLGANATLRWSEFKAGREL